MKFTWDEMKNEKIRGNMVSVLKLPNRIQGDGSSCL
jgi:hypothetical protein